MILTHLQGTDIIYLHGSESKFGVYTVGTCNHAASHLSTSGGNAAWNLELSNSYRASCQGQIVESTYKASLIRSCSQRLKHMYNIYTRTSVPQDKANTRHARFLPLSNSFDRVCLRCNLTLFTRRIKSCTGVFGLQDLSDFFRKGIFIESTQAEKYAQNSSLARNFIPGYFDRIFILSISSRVRTQRIFEMQ